MPLCRIAWQTITSRFARAAPQLHGRVPFRQMSSGGVPGTSGENLMGALLVVGAAGAGFFYAYRVISSDSARYNERIEQMQRRNTEEWKPKPWPPPSLENDDTETKEGTDTNEEAKDATAAEAEGVIAGESQVQSEEHAESTESEKGEESPVEEAISSVPEGEQDANSEAAQDQG